jgi:hypothetical protein
LLLEEFAKLGEKMNSELTAMDMRVRVLEKKNDIDKLKEILADKIGRDEFERSISELKHINIGQLQRNVEKMRKDIECIEVSNFAFLTIV